MNDDAARIERIAKSIMADENPSTAGKTSISFKNDTVNVTFSVNTSETDVFRGWMDTALQQKDKLLEMIKNKKIKLVEGVPSNASFTLSFKPKNKDDNKDDLTKFKNDLEEKYKCKAK